MKLIFPYSFIYVFIFLLGIIPPLPQISGYTHWIVTQHGMVEPITTSYYHLRQSWNLVKLMHQENNLEFVQRIELKLNKVSIDLQANQEYQNKVQKYYVDSDSRCVKASKLLSEFDLYSTHVLTLEAKGVASNSYLNMRNLTDNPTNSLKQPFCQSIFRRNFSMCCFEHLEAVRNRSSFEGIAEISLYRIAVPQHLTPDEYGHLVTSSLADNFSDPSVNWILYNMAAFYWRVKGMANNAIECLRAALHTSPFPYQDVALVSLANVLHLLKVASLDAVVLMKNAVMISPQFASHHLILGNIYASLGQFNNSLHHYKLAAKLYTPGKDKMKLKDIEDRIFAARCSYELSAAISVQQKKLDKQLEELESFQMETNRFQEAKSSLNFEKASNDTQQDGQVWYEAYIDDEILTASMVNRCFISHSNMKPEVACEPSEELLLASVYNDLNFTAGQLRSIKIPSEITSEDDANQPVKGRRYPRLSVGVHKLDSHIDMKESMCKLIQCDQVNKRIYGKEHLSIYLSPLNKGFDIDDILTKKQGLVINNEHPLPWYPPNCLLYVNKSDLVPVDVVDNLESLKQQHLMKQSDSDLFHHADNSLMEKLLQLVHHSNMHMEDIGQRIVTAIKKKLMPHWIIFNIAGLYWRVLGNLVNALECQKLSVKLSPFQYRDVSLVNLAVILARLKKNADALKLIKAALQIDYSEPETHIMAASLYNEQEKFNLAHHHLSIAITQDSSVSLVYFDLDFIKCRLCKKYYQTNFTRHSLKRNRALRHNVTQIFVNYKMCSSTTECSNIIGKNYQFLPHIKVTLKGPAFSSSDIEKLTTIDMDLLQKDVINSNVMYGILWNTNLSNLHIQEHECLLTNDSSRSTGCHHNNEIFTASQNAINFLAELRTLIENMSKPVMEKISSKWSDNKHICHNDRPKTTRPDDIDQPTLKSSIDDIQESIVNMISSRVVLNPLAPEDCEKVAPFDFKTYTPLYVSLNTMRINVISLLDSLVPGFLFTFNQHPYCVPKGNNCLRQIIEKYQIDFESSQHSKVPEYNLHASFLKTFDDKYSLEDIGKRLYTGLEQNSTDWRLATIVVNYWRVSGDAQQAFNCLELAMENSPEFHEKVILVNAANILYRINKLEAALEIAHKALQYPESQNWIVIPFLVANIFARMDQWHKATLFYEVCLSLKADFEEAIYRIKSIQCQQMVLQNLEQH